MTTTFQLVSPRLVLREWQERDRASFAAMNADPAVMRYFPAPFALEESNEAADRYNAQLERDGFTMFAVEDRSTGNFVGAIGAQTMRFAIPNLPQPAVEIGWRLATASQGRGLATEGATAVLDHLRQLGTVREVVAITTPSNLPSRRVMQKLGMQHRLELTFNHPLVPDDSPLKQHVLYSLAL
jgi:RimJ/RimL family protein N-acetyltransferase